MGYIQYELNTCESIKFAISHENTNLRCVYFPVPERSEERSSHVAANSRLVHKQIASRSQGGTDHARHKVQKNYNILQRLQSKVPFAVKIIV